MNVKYYYEFKGYDNILNRVEILTDDNVAAQEVTCTTAPFVLEYSEVKKLTPVQGSGATMELVSKENFQFESLHTDNMQDYMVKFYRGGSLYWMGWLDPELYEENLSLFPPYPVSFTAADFNVLERLQYQDTQGNNYTDIVPMITHLQRCFSKLNLPFTRLAIGCSTTADGITLSADETIFHKLYIQSANFYDEDGKPMTCREVIESILQPFGLMMVQRDASVYIYDYNTVVGGGVMKYYGPQTFAYFGELSVSFELGDMSDIGFMSSNSPYGFEDMINNVSITSSLYAQKELFNHRFSKDTASEQIGTTITGDGYTLEKFAADEKVEVMNGADVRIYTNTENDSQLVGLSIPYNPTVSTPQPVCRIKLSEYILRQEAFNNNGYLINIKMQAYANTRENVFDDEDNPDTEFLYRLQLPVKIYMVDQNDNVISNFIEGTLSWSDDNSASTYLLFTADMNVENSQVLNTWATNSNSIYYLTLLSTPITLAERDFGVGRFIPLVPLFMQVGAAYGYLVVDIMSNAGLYTPLSFTAEENIAENILINDISISMTKNDRSEISVEDYEFRSYINKNVATDLEEVRLKCISANSDLLPIGKGNILKHLNDGYELQLSYARSSQTTSLERLLLCTIHSNYTRKNKVFTVDLRTTDNPAMRYSTFNSLWSGEQFMTSGCRIDFNRAVTNLKVYNFSEDTDKLSDLPT